MSADWRRYVDLPAMFGPVRMTICAVSGSSSRSLATNTPAGSDCSTSGWRPALMRSLVPALTSGRRQPSLAAAVARLVRASIAPMARAVARSGGPEAATRSPSSRRISSSRAFIFSRALSTTASFSLSSVVT